MSAPASQICYGVWYAATEDRSGASLAAAQKASHDSLIAGLGERRLSGVTWQRVPSREALQLLDEMGCTEAGYDGLRAFLRRHPGGYLVIAMAEAIAP